MIRSVLCALATALIAVPATALTQIGVISGGAGDVAYASLPMLDGPGVYGVSLRFDRPGAEVTTEFNVLWVFNFYCDFGGAGMFEYCGGDDVPGQGFYRDDVPGLRQITGLYRIDRPYTHFDSPISYETGFYFADGAQFTYVFGDPGQVNWQLDITRLADVPEPAAWALMIAGFGLTGAAMRRRAAATG